MAIATPHPSPVPNLGGDRAQHLPSLFSNQPDLETVFLNWLRVLFYFDAKFSKVGSNCALSELRGWGFDSFPAIFAIIPVF
jgi:hypothetical protein